eukprot:TRINITY_DN23042_c0_g1_i1.p2 TRINITY_DN23042_c0_g1~~TRINITY_DN23042_c0_g1_i1.p2  ORF type:complete len:104 (-),score=26.48 TRINITY_DN23042_c0_g1_i1:178-489(-)
MCIRDSFTSVYQLVSFGRQWNNAETFGENTDLQEAMGRFMRGRVNAQLLPGQRVTVVGLKQAPSHNNQLGSVQMWHEDKERYAIKLDNGNVVAVRRSNLRTPY